jgi:hypothetical protein
MNSDSKSDEIMCYCRYITNEVYYKITLATRYAERSYGGWARPIDEDESEEIPEAQYLSIPALAVYHLTNGNKDQMITQMDFKYPCMNDGCKVKSPAGEKRADHRASCPRRKVACFAKDCKEMLTLPTLAEHFKSTHQGYKHSVNDKGKISSKYALPNHTDMGHRTWDARLIGDNLALFARCNPQGFICYCRYVSTPVIYKVTVTTPHASRSYGGWARPMTITKMMRFLKRSISLSQLQRCGT